MTTVAWCPRTTTLAADSRGTDDYNIPCRVPKIWRLPDGALFGASGEGSIAVQVLLWLEGRREKPELTAKEGDDFAGLYISADGSLYSLDDHRLEFEYHYPQPLAIGTGAQAAVAFMRDGSNAVEAVRKVIRLNLDASTGGRVQFLKFRRKQAHPRRPDANTPTK